MIHDLGEAIWIPVFRHTDGTIDMNFSHYCNGQQCCHPYHFHHFYREP